MSTLLLAGYIIVAVLSLALTQQERHLHPEQPQAFAILGIVACLLWPIPVVVALIMLIQQGNGSDAQTGPAARRPAR